MKGKETEKKCLFSSAEKMNCHVVRGRGGQGEEEDEEVDTEKSFFMEIEDVLFSRKIYMQLTMYTDNMRKENGKAPPDTSGVNDAEDAREKEKRKCEFL